MDSELNTLRTIRAPISVNFEVTTSCDLECSFCFVEAWCRRPHPPLKQAMAILDRLAEAGVFEVRLFGGEFFVYPWWKEVMEYAHAKGFFLSFISNGTHVIDEVVDVMLKCGVKGGGLSLHGPKEVHEAITKVSGSYSLVLEAIERCLDAGLEITVLTTLTQENKNSIYDIVASLATKGLVREKTTYAVGRLCPYGRGASEWDKSRLSLRDYRNLFDTLERIEADFDIPTVLGDAFPLCLVKKKQHHLIQGCWQATGFGHVGHDGTVKGCGIATKSFGNLLVDPLDQIWQSPELVQYRQLEWLPDKCRSCNIFCGGGCMASAIDSRGYAPDEFLLEISQ